MIQAHRVLHRGISLCFLLFLTIGLWPKAAAQMPNCTAAGGGIVYMQIGATIYNWDPGVPLSTTNPSTNTISVPAFANGLAVSPNLNSTTAPSPTFYTAMNGTFHYWNGTAWINTGHLSQGVNLGSGGGYLYTLDGIAGQVYQYDGTGDATLLITIPGFFGGGPYDIIADCEGNFYVLRVGGGGPDWMRKYTPAGVMIQEWTVTGALTGGAWGGGFAIIGNKIYYDASSLMEGVVGATSIAFSPMPGAYPGNGDFASCPVPALGVVNALDTAYNCLPGSGKILTIAGDPPYSCTVISGAATVTGTGPSFTINNTTPAMVVLGATSTSICNPVLRDTYLVVPPIVVDAGPDDIFYGCNSYRDTLKGSFSNATSWITYTQSWTPAGIVASGGNTATPIVTPVSDTTFVYTITTSAAQGGCTFTDSVRIKVKDETVLPDYNFTIIKGCNGDSVIFTNTSTQSTASFWDFDDGFNDTVTHPKHFYPNQDNYQVKLIASNYLCKDSVIKIVDTRHPLEAAYTVDNDTICENTMVSFTGTSTVSVAPATYFWDFGDGGSSTLLSPTHLYTVPGTYRVMLAIKDAVPCADTTYYTIVVDSIPQLSFVLDDHDICTGQSINVQATHTLSGHTGLEWNFGDGDLITNINPTGHAYEIPGTYFITATGRYRVCSDITQRDSVNVHAQPLVNLGKDSVLCLQGAPIFLRNLEPAQPGDTYRWNNGDTSAVLKVVHHGNYSLTVSSAYDCNTTDEVIVAKDCYVDVPNSFTPNSDGFNDYFFPRQLLSRSVTGFNMKVFNRWGQVVFQTQNTNGRGWDGTFNGKDQPVGVYIYTIDVTLNGGQTEQYTGNVTLLR